MFQSDDPSNRQALVPLLVRGRPPGSGTVAPPLGPHLVLFADVVELKAPGMGPDSAQHLEVLEEFGPSASLAPLVGVANTCTRGGCFKKTRQVPLCVRVRSCLTSQYNDHNVAVLFLLFSVLWTHLDVLSVLFREMSCGYVSEYLCDM